MMLFTTFVLFTVAPSPPASYNLKMIYLEQIFNIQEKDLIPGSKDVKAIGDYLSSISSVPSHELVELWETWKSYDFSKFEPRFIHLFMEWIEDAMSQYETWNSIHDFRDEELLKLWRRTPEKFDGEMYLRDPFKMTEKYMNVTETELREMVERFQDFKKDIKSIQLIQAQTLEELTSRMRTDPDFAKRMKDEM